MNFQKCLGIHLVDCDIKDSVTTSAPYLHLCVDGEKSCNQSHSNETHKKATEALMAGTQYVGVDI